MTRISLFGALALTVALGACAQVRDSLSQGGSSPDAAAPAGSAPVPEGAPETPEEVAAVVEAPAPSAAARTADDFDTTTDAQKAAAQATPAAAGERLGEVTASLGDPSDAGLWIKSKLVSAEQPGRIENAATGTSALVELRPLEGEGGATLSLAAMRLLEIPLTDIPTITVYSR